MINGVCLAFSECALALLSNYLCSKLAPNCNRTTSECTARFAPHRSIESIALRLCAHCENESRVSSLAAQHTHTRQFQCRSAHSTTLAVQLINLATDNARLVGYECGLNWVIDVDIVKYTHPWQLASKLASIINAPARASLIQF